MAIQDRATKGEPLDALSLEYRLSRNTVYMITLRRKPKKMPKSGDGDPFVKLER